MADLPVKLGAYGAAVARLHEFLAQQGVQLPSSELDRAFFGPLTRQAVQQYQRKNGLPPSGEVDAKTALLIEAGIQHQVLPQKEPAVGPAPALSSQVRIPSSGRTEGVPPQEYIADISKGPPPASPPVPEGKGIVKGTLVDQDGAPIPNRPVSLFAMYIRSETHTGEATTGKRGEYTITYDRPNPVNLAVRAYDATGKQIGQSATAFAAPAEVQIDFTTAPDGIVRTPSTFTKLASEIAAQLKDTPLRDLKENKDTHELRFLASAIGANFNNVAYMFIGDVLGAQKHVRQDTFFGIFHQGLPPALDAALANLPDAGIDDAFMGQVLSGVLGQSRPSLSQALTSAINTKGLPQSYAPALNSELDRLDSLRIQSAGSTPYIRGKTPLNDLLAAGNVTDAVKTAFVEAYAANSGQLGPTWRALRANKKLPSADLATLNRTLSLGELLTGNLPLINDTFQRLKRGTLANVQNLALLDETDWVARIAAIDPEGNSIRQVLPGDTAQQRIERFAKELAARFSSRYPTTAFAGGLSKAKSSSFQSKDELVSFLMANPTLSFHKTNIDHFLATNKLTISALALADLKTAQRLFRASPHYAAVEALKNAGHTSAQSIYFKGRGPFLAEMTPLLGSAALAKMAYARAQMTYSTALMAFGRYNLAFNGINLAVFANPAPALTALTNLPDLQALFGSLDYFQCSDCQSVYSPAAYLVDLLQYLAQFPAAGGGVTNARDALFLRRPEIRYIALDCNNTNITLPYIDLVNEILEAAIAPPSTPVTVLDTTGTSAERRALPQQISQAAYALTANAVFPLSLPFDLAFAQTQAYIAQLGTTRAVILSVFAGNSVSAAIATTIACASLGINPEMQAVINGSDTHQQWERWGFSSRNPTSVIDPKTGNPYPSLTDWVAYLSKVPLVLNKTGLSLQQLYQLLEVIWVTQSSVTLQPGTTMSARVQILSPDTDLMIFTGLTGDVLDRANRFLRLWTTCGLQMWELDWALEAAPGGLLNDGFLVFLAGAIAAGKQLMLPFQEVLSFWMPLETRDVVNHLGDQDTVTPSTYGEVFRNPTVLASWSSVFVPLNQSTVTGGSNTAPITITTAFPHGYQTGQLVSITGVAGNTAANGTFTITVTDYKSFTLNGSAGNGAWISGGVATGRLSGNVIIPPGGGAATAEQNAITAALALGADDISAILAFTGAQNAVTLDALNVLLRYQRLASSLSLRIADLILWIELASGTPFGGTPAETLEFCRRLAVLQGTGLAVRDLDYLVRGQSAAQSSLTFTTAQATSTLQAIRDAIAKLPVPVTIPVTDASNTAPIMLSTAQPNGLQTGMRISISGALGNTAANGTFTITVTSPTSFTLNGSAGNGVWTGGVVTVNSYDDTTVQTIFVTALAAATGASANVVTPVLLRKGVLPLSSAMISQLLAQTSGVDPTQFPALVAAFASVSKAAALFSALKPTEAEFAFAVQNAATFNWLDPSALPITPLTASPYAAFEALLRAFKLDRRQPARGPKLFDVLNGWLPPNPVPPDLATAIGGPAIVGVSNSAPITVTTASPHYLRTGMQVTIRGVQGNTAANGAFTVTATGPTTFTLDGSAGNGVWGGGGSVFGLPCIALALNASAADVTALANALGATAASLTPAQLPGSLADVGTLAAIANALNVLVRYGISGVTLVQLSAALATADTASAARGALQAQYAQSAWFGAIQPVEDALRQARRDALVAYLLGPGPAVPAPPFRTSDDIFNYYLIDPEMSPCALMTRLLQASLAIQQFMQQCFLNLSFSYVQVDVSNAALAAEWSWRQQFRYWQANRMVFLYPENYLLPELRKDKSPFFTDFENDLRQSDGGPDAAEAALENYLRKVVGVARLRVAAHYNQTLSDGSTVLHVFASTNATPPQWYYRTRTSRTADSGSWSAWQPLNLDIASQHLLPVIWDQRLHLVWPVFKPTSEKQSDQKVPLGGGVTSSAPQQFWTVEFAMSQLSAGQWQAKQSIIDKMFFTKNTTIKTFEGATIAIIDRPPQAFTFRACQDPSFNLRLEAYYNASSIENFSLGDFPTILLTGQTAVGILTMPESSLTVTQTAPLLPDSSLVDLSQEPTYALVKTGTFSASLTNPTNYFFLGQDLVYGGRPYRVVPGYPTQELGKFPLNVLCALNNRGQVNSIELLGTISNPRTIVPIQEPVFDSTDPFFIAEPERTWLVQPRYYTISSRPQELTSLRYISQWNTKYEFQTFYHPYARTFLRELEIGGVPQLMARSLQVNPQAVRGWTPSFDFNALYNPKSPLVATPYPGAPGAPDPGESALDFAPGSSGAYSLYNWEVFYHVPMFAAALLLQNAVRSPAGADQQFRAAVTWLEYIFNPTDSTGGPAPQRYWQMAPFYAMTAANWIGQEIQNLLSTLAANTQQGISDPATTAAIDNWMNHPFDPHAVASLRIAAYAKATVMKLFDVLIAWGDWYYAQYTAEKVGQAEQLYILVDMMLGPKPQMLRLPNAEQGGAGTVTYASLRNIDPFSNVLVQVENVIVAPEPPTALVQGSAEMPSLPRFPGGGNTLLFCIPPNGALLAYWDTISKRLYNIRHCLNIKGVPQPLPLYAPPISPLELIEAGAAGAGFAGAIPAAPIYRFAVYLQRAFDLTNDVRSYGALILSALEKEDAETLAAMRANQELDIQIRMLDLKNLQVQEAQAQITALQNQKAVVEIRYSFYSNIGFMNAWEITAFALQGAALIANRKALILDLTASAAHLVPGNQFGAAGFGGSALVTVIYGGENVASAAASHATAVKDSAGILSEAASMAATVGGYQRRKDEWDLQAQLAQAEMTQIDSQIAAATDRLNIAQQEVAIQNAQIANARAVSDFLTNKYTNAQLYDWMVSQLTTVYTQAYQLAFSLALQAQNAYQYELGSQDTFIQFGYWDSQHKGLTAGESLLFDLRRMEAQYLAQNTRELELTKHISLALTNPLALVILRETGTCQIALDEALFEYDHPGQYFRRLRWVALTIPCVTGPYTGVNATLSLTGAMVRTQPPSASSYQPQSATGPPNPGVIVSPVAAAGTATIATSSGQNDSGLFDANAPDERWRPFEGQGAISTWNLVLDPRDNNFDFTTITDVVLHIRYTARGGADQTAADYVRSALRPQGPRSILISARNTFSDTYYSFFNPGTTPATDETLILPLTNMIFPFSNLGTGGVKIESITFYLVLSVAAAGNTIPAIFGPTGGTMSAISLAPAPGQTTAGNPLNALKASVPLSPALNAPQSLSLTVPIATLPPGLSVTTGGQTLLDPSKIEDILLIVEYSII
jgi:Tc toxin complex TcA C-terminal TcB-binding domain/Neuraminidase-like domain/Putative peptidoglycan binding domain/Salmonella virulence plasmid 28.1kDa A protein